MIETHQWEKYCESLEQRIKAAEAERDAARREVEEQRRAALEDAANLSPNGLDVNGDDAPHLVWKKYSDGLRALAEKGKP